MLASKIEQGKGKVFKYVLSVMDVFSRYQWLVPLERKLSSHVARELRRVYRENGVPRVIQHDQGPEFDGAVSRLCKKLKIKVIKGRPYHPQSQGKVERGHRSLREKISYDFLAMKKAGVNWVKALPSYTEALNHDPKEELAWKSPFEIYFGRKPNLVDNTDNTCAKELYLPLGKYEDMVRPRSKDLRSRSKHVKATRKQALSATEKCANRKVNKEAKKHPPSIYDLGETVLIRYPSTGSKIVKKRYVLEGKILKRNLKNGLYKVAFSSPSTEKRINKWISVCNITSTTMEKEKKKQKNVNDHDKKVKSAKALHVSKYKHAYQNEREFMEDRFEEAHFLISYDPPGDGNCQFSVICESLRSVGIDRSEETAREEIVEYLENHPHLQNFTTVAWPTYRNHGTRWHVRGSSYSSSCSRPL